MMVFEFLNNLENIVLEIFQNPHNQLSPSFLTAFIFKSQKQNL